MFQILYSNLTTIWILDQVRDDKRKTFSASTKFENIVVELPVISEFQIFS